MNRLKDNSVAKEFTERKTKHKSYSRKLKFFHAIGKRKCGRTKIAFNVSIKILWYLILTLYWVVPPMNLIFLLP